MNSWAQGEGQPGLGYIFWSDDQGAWGGPIAKNLGQEPTETLMASLGLGKGDAAFFNPAVFHGAGNNVSTDVQRMANLLQVSSAFGRAMESVDRARVTKAVYPALVGRAAEGWTSAALACAVAASAEGYPFPTNLDLDQPIGGLTPLSQADIVHRALDEGWAPAQLDDAIDAYAGRRSTRG
jgi:ectoine hydroxylase-related dioxygenase (phytanoyl-CoA dioxygenase family)